MLRGGSDLGRATVEGEGSARRPPSGRNRFFGKTYVTAEAVTYKAAARKQTNRREVSMVSRWK